MIEPLPVVLLGFFLGMRHATDADHVLAVTTIVSRQRTIRRAAAIGALWGMGHSLTILFVGSLIILFGVVIPPRLGLGMELGVALMLVILGVWNLKEMLGPAYRAPTPGGSPQERIHSHAHSHGDYVHTHPHGHGPGAHGHDADRTPQAWLDRVLGRLGLYQILRPLVVGFVHGLAGSAAVALLVLATIRSPLWAILYLLVFGVGTIAGMGLTTMAIAVPFAYTATRFARLHRSLAAASGLLSLVVGLFLVYQIGFVQGFFSTGPRWTPE
ncbi:MAG: high-affinity nickel-transport family protein [Candidatus Rokubacteria bacterium]|nr:high-affinity nickel-transport family protein [Candidatus Rokubacteria bacterium]